MPKPEPNRTKCKARRLQLVEKQKTQKAKLKQKIRKERDPNAPKGERQTTDNKRVLTDDLLLEQNDDVDEEETFDEFASFFDLSKTPKVLLTTSEKPSKTSFEFLMEFKNFLPNSFYYPRKRVPLPSVARQAKERGFTHVVVIHERFKVPYTVSIATLPEGPTIVLRVRKYVPPSEISNIGNPTGYEPELIVRNFQTPLGRRLGRGLSSMFNLNPDFKGRTVVTLYNFRDFIFFRHHRYLFKKDKPDPEDEEKKDPDVRAALQEIGPRMIFQLRKMYSGCFNEVDGQFEYFYRGGHYVKRSRFFL